MKKCVFLLPRAVIFSVLLLLIIIQSHAQSSYVSGKVIDANGTPVAGATVKIKNKKEATQTNAKGEFVFNDISGNNIELVITHVGFMEKEVICHAGVAMTISMEEANLKEDEIVVTGVFDKRKRMEASIAISSITAATIARVTPVSAADLLKSVPGVYVNSSLGEIRNTVYSRGVSVGSNDGASGYYYVSMQEDGLPVTNATFGNYGPDYYLRADATLGRLDAVRGGTASILGANAPGGIFNYVMKEGTDKTQGELRTKYGLEGNGRNNFYRADFNVGGPLGNNLYYDAGGFYRYDEGARYPGYPLNNGGQFKANIVKKYSSGSLKLYAKYLNDHNGWFEFTPTVGFSDPRPAPGFTDYSSVLMPAVQQNFPMNQTGQTVTYNNRDLIHSIDRSVGLNWEQRFGTGWTFNNAMRYSDKTSTWNTNAIVYPLPMNDLVTYAILGFLGKPGTYTFRGLNSGKDLLNVTSFSGYDFNVTSNSLPGNDVAPNSLFFEPLFYVDNRASEYLDQFSLTKKLHNMSFTFGGFYGASKIDHISAIGGLGLGTVQDRPELAGITFSDSKGNVEHVTNSNGIMGVGASASYNYATQNQLAFFFGHNWQLTEKLNLDWGLRYETVHVKGHNSPGVSNPDSTGGLDKDPNTLYDNAYGTTPATYYFDKVVSTLSYSAGLNYKFNNSFAVYGRVSEGNKAPDVDMYFSATSDFLARTLDPVAQKVQQVEAGVKVNKGSLNLFVTPFYSILSHVASVQAFQNADQTFYNTPTLYNKYRTLGVEVEANYGFGKHFNVHGAITLQRSKALDFHTYLANGFGAADDSLVSYSGNETDNIARSLINITPSYTIDRFFAQLTWSYMGKRQANVANAFQLPAFSQFNLSAGYDVSRHLQLGLTINNLLNKYGVMSWSRPGGFLAALDRQGFTKEMYQKAVASNTTYSTVAIPARAYYINATFKF